MSSLLFFLATGSESWSSKRLSKVLSELGDFLIVIPILAFLTPSGGLDFLHKDNQICHLEYYKYLDDYFWISVAGISFSVDCFLSSLGLELGDLLLLLFSLEVIKASQSEFLDFSWNFSELIICPILIFGLIDSFFGLFIT